MPTLHWIGKDKVLNHHLEVPFRILRQVYTHGDSTSGNRILHGDNLEALGHGRDFWGGEFCGDIALAEKIRSGERP